MTAHVEFRLKNSKYGLVYMSMEKKRKTYMNFKFSVKSKGGYNNNKGL